MLALQMVLTQGCNLRCSYCYVQQKPKEMTECEIDHILNNLPAYQNKFGYKDFSMNFFGGEPMLRFDLVTYILDKIRGDKRFVRRLLTTNGLLLDQEKVDYLRNQNVLIAVSFDGLWNSFNRRLATGESSYEKYLERKDFFKQFGSTRAMISPASVTTLVDNYKEFVDNWGFCFQDLALIKDHTWKADDVSRYDIYLSLLTETIIEYWNKGIPNLPSLYKNFMLAVLQHGKYGKPLKGCECCTWMINFMPGGLAYGCGRFGYAEDKPIYNYMEGGWLEDNLKFYQRPDIFYPPYLKYCQECDIYSVCPTGCLFDDLVKTKGEYKREPIDEVCNIYRITFREAMRLFKELKNRPDFQSVFRSKVFSQGGLN